MKYLLILCLLVLTSCSSISLNSIEDIQKNPEKYVNTNVTVKGIYTLYRLDVTNNLRNTPMITYKIIDSNGYSLPFVNKGINSLVGGEDFTKIQIEGTIKLRGDGVYYLEGSNIILSVY